MARSLVIWSPPTGTEARRCSLPSWKKAISVVPPPISTRNTPSSFSSAERATSAAASGCSTMPVTLIPARLTQRVRLRREVMGLVTIMASTSRRTPSMPAGSRIPSYPSTTNSRGITSTISRSRGRAITRAACITRSISSSLISRSSDCTATTPRLLISSVFSPGRPTQAESILKPHIRSASAAAKAMASMVSSRSTMIPFFIPSEGDSPRPIMLTVPSGRGSPTITRT